MTTSGEPPSGPYRVFLSHSSKDKGVARLVRRLIELEGLDLGVDVFFDDRALDGGDVISEEIREALRACDEFLVLLSQDALESQWVQQEMGAAWILGKHRVAVMYRITADDLPDTMKTRKAIDLDQFESYSDELLGRVKDHRSVT
jgi:hypothetical protein